MSVNRKVTCPIGRSGILIPRGDRIADSFVGTDPPVTLTDAGRCSSGGPQLARAGRPNAMPLTRPCRVPEPCPGATPARDGFVTTYQICSVPARLDRPPDDLTGRPRSNGGPAQAVSGQSRSRDELSMRITACGPQGSAWMIA